MKTPIEKMIDDIKAGRVRMTGEYIPLLQEFQRLQWPQEKRFIRGKSDLRVIDGGKD